MRGAIFLGRYEAINFLGRGSMGQVFLARPVGQPERRVVVKTMHPQVAGDPAFRTLFANEMQYMARLRHPYAVRLLDSSIDDPRGPCIVMEYIPGITLEALLRREPCLAPERVGRLLGILCHALDAAHSLGIIHRDLKPANLMVVDAGTPNESLRVMDFGLAHLASKPHLSIEALNGSDIGHAVGTPCYMPPEQIRGDESDARGDLYSVGVMLYEMLTGALPFDHADTDAILRAHLFESPARFAHAADSDLIPPALEAVVLRCLAKYPVERPQTAGELARNYGESLGLEFWESTRPPALEPEPPPPPPPPAPPKPKSSLFAALASRKPADLYTVTHSLDAWMPEKIAVVKLRGFVEDAGGKVISSEPGLIRVQLGIVNPDAATTPTGIAGWLGRLASEPKPKAPAADAVEIELQLEKPNPNENRLRVTAVFRPVPGYPLRQPRIWRERCERIHNDLRAYLMAQR